MHFLFPTSPNDLRIDDEDAENQFHQYLQKLSKNELVASVEEFASE